MVHTQLRRATKYAKRLEAERAERAAEQAKLRELQNERFKKEQRKENIAVAVTVTALAAALGYAAWDAKHTDHEVRNRAVTERVLQNVADCERYQNGETTTSIDNVNYTYVEREM